MRGSGSHVHSKHDEKPKINAKDVIKVRKKTDLLYVKEEDVIGDDTVHAKAHYLYWACFRGDIQLIRYLIDTDAISPFLCIYEGRSPLMASLIGKPRPIVVS